MARNDIYLNINSLSVADAVVTGQQDMTAATIPELVLGDTPTFNFYFTDNTNVWPSWAGNASYSLTWALSDAVSGDFAPAATTGNATPITGGWSVVLPLNSYDLVGLLNGKRIGQSYPVQNLWQQLRVTDPSGNEVTRAMVWTPVRYRAISDTQNTESASPTGGRFVTVNNTNELTTPTAAQFYAANEVPTSALGTAANGELLIGNGTGFTKATLTAGTGVTITNGSGSVTIDATNAQEILTATVKNAESIAITKGQVVYLFGATGNMASVKLAYNTSDATSAKTFGVVADASISAGGTGTVTCVGVLDGLNLGSYNEGDTLYLGATAGSVTAIKPYAPNHLVYVGIVERANNGNGEMYVKIQNGYELDEIHDVQITAPKNTGQTIVYDSATSLWKNSNAVVVSGGSVNASPIGASSPNTGAFTTLSASGNLTVSGSGTIDVTNAASRALIIGPVAQSGGNLPYASIKTSSTFADFALNLENTNATAGQGLGLRIIAGSASNDLPLFIKDRTNATTLFSVGGTGNTTLAGNLTVSGTGTSSVAGSLGIGTTSPQYPLQVSAPATASYYPIALSSGVIGTIGNTVGMRFGFTGITYQKGAIIYESISANGVGKLHFALNAGENSSNATLTDSKAVLTSTGRFLLGTGGADSGALLQVGTNTSNSTGGIGFGTDTFLYRSTAGYLILQAGTGTAGSLQLYEGASTMRSQFAFAAGNTYLDASTGSLILRTNGSTTALTLDSSQRCILAGALRLNNAYTAGAPTATGYVTLQDSAGNTYKVLVGT